MTETIEKVKCQFCGKYIPRSSLKDGVVTGHRCQTLLDQGYTAKSLQDHRLNLTAKTVPTGWIKVSQLHALIDKNKSKVGGLTVSKMVNAIGKDRALDNPINPICKPIYDEKGHRWVNPWLGTQAGLKAIATGDFSKAPKV